MSVAFFLEMAWKSGLIAGAALLLVSLLRGRSASERAAVLRIGVGMLLLLPAIALGLPALQVEAWTAEALPIGYIPSPDLLTYTPAAALPAAEKPTIWDDPTILFAILYAGGLLMASLRLFAGLWTLQRWTAAARAVNSPEWLVALARARAAMPSRRPVRLLVCDELTSPLSWGWARPVIMIDPDTLRMSEDAEAILAHEWAHVVRQDWPVLMLSRTVSALFWFNPLVWMLEREIVQQAEEAADGFAARSVEPARYAQTLVKWAQFGTHGLPANSMAPATAALARRVRAILEGAPKAGRSRSAATMAAMAVCATFAAALAALELVPGEAIAAEAPAPVAAVAPAEAQAAPEPPAAMPAPAPAALQAPEAAPAARVAQAPAAAEAPAAPVPAVAPQPPEPIRIPAKVRDAHAAAQPMPQPGRISFEQLERARPDLAVSIREARRAGHVVSVNVDERRIEREVERAIRHLERSAARERRHDHGERAPARLRLRAHGPTYDQLAELYRERDDRAREAGDDDRDSRHSSSEIRDGH